MAKKQPKPFKPRAAHGPEYYIRADIIRLLKLRGWSTYITHGNQYQQGFPDIYALHPRYGQRWIDAKNPDQYTFTSAQKVMWPEWDALGMGVWIMVAGSQAEYEKLMGKPNWRDYWKPQWDDEREELKLALEALYREYEEDEADSES